MSEWLKKNSWALIIACATVVSSYSIASYRITDLEVRLTKDESRIEILTGVENSNQVRLAEIQKDIEYIKLQLTKLIN